MPAPYSPGCRSIWRRSGRAECLADTDLPRPASSRRGNSAEISRYRAAAVKPSKARGMFGLAFSSAAAGRAARLARIRSGTELGITAHKPWEEFATAGKYSGTTEPDAPNTLPKRTMARRGLRLKGTELGWSAKSAVLLQKGDQISYPSCVEFGHQPPTPPVAERPEAQATVPTPDPMTCPSKGETLQPG
jgi:hypothetical protein